ncbi:putative membrane protein [Flavobacterium sp. 7E]|uniref:SRPBCC family protein n=1 Tax=Flavobacterium sp. 7E TaxID=2735898 RepID=UPI00156F06A1|nr:SRPBCC family protein [Flavobacterium sp. 7E]NRS88441.1 putative membrane protein [Flavobacterium sp. 7E]
MSKAISKNKLDKNESLIKANVPKLERVLMVAAGSYLLYKALSKKKKNITKTTAASGMLLRGLTGYCPVYSAIEHIKEDSSSNITIRLKETINKPVGEVYAFWRNIENLPKFMNHLESVKIIDHNLSEWTAKGPAGLSSLSWKAEIVREVTDTVISWQSIENATVENTGKVSFTPKGNTTDVDIIISYHAPLGSAGEKAAQFLNPYFKSLVKKDLHNFKSFIENLKDMK